MKRIVYILLGLLFALQVYSSPQIESECKELLQTSELYQEIEIFKKLYGTYPHRYVYSDGANRNITLEFLSPDTILLTNAASNELLAFEERYKVGLINDGKQRKYILLERVCSTRKDTLLNSCQLHPFNSSDAANSYQILSDLTKETLSFFCNESIIILGNLCFRTEGIGRYGSWYTKRKKLKLTPFYTKKIDEIESLISNHKIKIDNQEYKVDTALLEFFWSFHQNP